jgi:hypothetical protein
MLDALLAQLIDAPSYKASNKISIACCDGAQAVKKNVTGNNAIMRSICNSPSNDAEIVCLNELSLLVLVDELEFKRTGSCSECAIPLLDS